MIYTWDISHKRRVLVKTDVFPFEIENVLSLGNNHLWISSKDQGQYLFNTLRIHERHQTPVRVVSSSMVMLRSMLAEGDYISIVSRHQISVDEELGMITALDIPLEGHLRDIGLTYRKSWRPTLTQARFIDFLHEFSQPNSGSDSSG